jgi:fluoride exporter
LLSVGVGAILGAWLRWWLSIHLNPVHASLPLGTLAANIGGGFLIGMALAWFAAHPTVDPNLRLVVITGFLGALTTFSSFSAESLTLLQKDQWLWAAAHSAIHLFGSLAAAALGFRLLTR